MTRPSRWLRSVPPGLAIILGGNLWMARDIPFAVATTRLSTQPVLVLVALVLAVAAPTIAARPLLRPTRTTRELPGEKLVCVSIPTVTTLLVPTFYIPNPMNGHLGWWTQVMLPLSAAVTGRWGLRAGLTAITPACLLTVFFVTTRGPSLANWAGLVNVTSALVGWVLATHFLTGMLRGQADQSRALRGATSEAETRSAQNAEVLNAVPAQFLARIRPTLDRIMTGDAVDAGLRAECARLEKQVRTELAARRLLTEDGPGLVSRLQATGWLIRIDDQGPIGMRMTALETVRAITRDVLVAAAQSGCADGTVSIRMPSGRFLATVVVTGQGAAQVSAALTGCGLPHSLDADPDEEPVLYAEIQHMDAGLEAAAGQS